MANFAVILPAAGKSSRFSVQKRKKPFVELKGRPVWVRAAEIFLSTPMKQPGNSPGGPPWVRSGSPISPTLPPLQRRARRRSTKSAPIGRAAGPIGVAVRYLEAEPRSSRPIDDADMRPLLPPGLSGSSKLLRSVI